MNTQAWEEFFSHEDKYKAKVLVIDVTWKNMIGADTVQGTKNTMHKLPLLDLMLVREIIFPLTLVTIVSRFITLFLPRSL